MKQVLFLYNPQSGKGKIEKDSQAIGEMFRQAGYSIVDGPIDFSRNPFNGHETVDLVVVAGGDGTVNYVVNRMKEKHLDLLLGIIPAGTANDFAGADAEGDVLDHSTRFVAFFQVVGGERCRRLRHASSP